MDCLHVLFPTYDYYFLFDHSCGHDKQRPDGLSVNRLSKYFGGQQPKMRDSMMKTAEYFGPFNRNLEVGETQHMVFQETDDGPFWMTDQERQENKYDRPTERTIEIEIPVIKEGWAGKPKGMLQILWERGWLDPSVDPQAYTIAGKKDLFGNVDESMSLKNMMLGCLDFMEEETLLQYHGRMMGCFVDRTPKCHPELAGEGIEYAWGCAKGLYRRHALNKQQFTNKENDGNDNNNNNTQPESQTMSCQMIEKLVKKYKSHRSVMDTDNTFVNDLVKLMLEPNV